MRTTDDLITNVREAIDEDETSDISDASILRALNRAQLRLQRIGAKRWPVLFKKSQELTFSGRSVAAPTEAYGWLLSSVDVKVGESWLPMTPAKQSQIVHEDTSASAAQPEYWVLRGKYIDVYPKASNSTIRVWFQRRLPELVVSQGLIDSVTAGDASTDTRFYLNSVGSGLTTSTTNFGAFVNVVDPNSGEVLGTYQTTAVGGTYIDVGTPTRTTAYGQTVIDGQQTQAQIEADDCEYPAQDDYVCSAAGTCVPPIGPDLADYLVNAATVILKRKVGEDIAQERDALKELEDDLDTLWAGRPGTKRVQRRNPIWGGAGQSIQSKYRG